MPRSSVRPMMLALSLGLVVLTSGCPGEASPEEATPTPVPTATPTPGPTPEPLTLQDGDYGLWTAYVIPRNDGWLEPTGSLSLQETQLSGTLSWKVYMTVDDYYARKPTCVYGETVTGEVDPSLGATSSCVDCGVFYRMTLGPSVPQPDGGEIPVCQEGDVGYTLLLDANNSGAVSEGEINHPDLWGFSSLAEENWPPMWTEGTYWEDWEDANGYPQKGQKTRLLELGALYAAWSREWHPPEAAYLPIFALYPAE